MSATRMFRRLATAAVVVFASMTTVVLGFAAPAHAEGEVEVDVDFSSNIVAGRNVGLQAVLENRTQSDLAPIRHTIIIKLPGLTSDGVRGTRDRQQLQVSGSQGEIRLVDPTQSSLGANRARDSVRLSFSLQFQSIAPNGRGEIIVEARRNNSLLGSDARNFTLRGGASTPPTPTPTPDATPTNAAPEPTAADPDQTTAAQGLPGDDQTSAANTTGTAGVPVIFYVMGIALFAAGGAILYFLVRQRPAMAGVDSPTGSHDIILPPRQGYPHDAGGRPGGPDSSLHHPTTVMPTVHQGPPPSPMPPTRQMGPVPPLERRQPMPPSGPPSGPPMMGRPGPGIPPPVDPWQGPTDDNTGGFGRHSR